MMNIYYRFLFLLFDIFCLINLVNCDQQQSSLPVTSTTPQFSINSKSIVYPGVHQTISTCFGDCIQKTVVSPAVGCKGVDDWQCFCSKQIFVNATNFCVLSTGGRECKSLTKDKKTLDQDKTVLKNFCDYVNTYYVQSQPNSTVYYRPITDQNSKYPSRKGSGHSGTITENQNNDLAFLILCVILTTTSLLIL